MKLYNVLLDDGRSEEVLADSFMLVDDKYLFYAHGEAIPDIFFHEDCVKGINLISDDPDRDFQVRGGGSY